MAQWFFGKTLKLVPLSGFVPGLDLLKFLALPMIVGIVFQLGSEARLFRAMLLEEIGKDYVRTARSKGLAESTVLFGHVLRNTWLPVASAFPNVGTLSWTVPLDTSSRCRLRVRNMGNGCPTGVSDSLFAIGLPTASPTPRASAVRGAQLSASRVYSLDGRRLGPCMVAPVARYAGVCVVDRGGVRSLRVVAP
jgi:hypothetical protein